jgi:transcription initiation factor TFIIIB Brf1 subunit/transcription initiation factor TFIIB
MDAMTKDQKCPDCGSCALAEVDGSDLTCTNCGLVVQSGLLSFDPEWRSFAEEYIVADDPSRVGDASMAPTIISQKPALNALNRRVCAEPAQKKVLDAREFFLQHRDHMSFSDAVIDSAIDILQAFEKTAASGLKGDMRRKALLAACAYYAFKEIPGNTRSKDEICATLSIDSKVFTKVHAALKDALLGSQYDVLFNKNGVRIIDLVNRYVQTLPLKRPALTEIRKTVLKLYDRVKGVEAVLTIAPVTLLTTLIYMACMYLRQPITMKQVSISCGASLTTIINTENLLKELVFAIKAQ